MSSASDLSHLGLAFLVGFFRFFFPVDSKKSTQTTNRLPFSDEKGIFFLC